MEITSKYEKIQNACYWLNYHARLINKSKKQFTPCPRANILIQSYRDNSPLQVAIDSAIYHTHCACHPNLTETILLDYMFDNRAKLAYQNGSDVALATINQ